MSYERLAKARKKTVGAKQTLKAVEKSRAKVVYVAKNAERYVVERIVKICETKNIPVIQVENMQSLGKACYIDVSCAIASIVEE